MFVKNEQTENYIVICISFVFSIKDLGVKKIKRISKYFQSTSMRLSKIRTLIILYEEDKKASRPQPRNLRTCQNVT